MRIPFGHDLDTFDFFVVDERFDVNPLQDPAIAPISGGRGGWLAIIQVGNEVIVLRRGKGIGSFVVVLDGLIHFREEDCDRAEDVFENELESLHADRGIGHNGFQLG